MMVILVYLIMIFRLVAKIKSEQTEYWMQIGSPSLSDPNGQFSILWKIIFAADLPSKISTIYRKELVMVRVLLALSMFLLVIAGIMELWTFLIDDSLK